MFLANLGFQMPHPRGPAHQSPGVRSSESHPQSGAPPRTNRAAEPPSKKHRRSWQSEDRKRFFGWGRSTPEKIKKVHKNMEFRRFSYPDFSGPRNCLLWSVATCGNARRSWKVGWRWGPRPRRGTIASHGCNNLSCGLGSGVSSYSGNIGPFPLIQTLQTVQVCWSSENVWTAAQMHNFCDSKDAGSKQSLRHFLENLHLLVHLNSNTRGYSRPEGCLVAHSLPANVARPAFRSRSPSAGIWVPHELRTPWWCHRRGPCVILASKTFRNPLLPEHPEVVVHLQQKPSQLQRSSCYF